MKLLLKIRYMGTAYAGYQVQKNAPTIQSALNAAAADLFGYPCDITGCSRTDAGVHALCFCATIQKKDCEFIDTSIPADKIPPAFNFRLPDDISVCGAVFVPDDFHPRYSVVSKTYEYHILASPYRNPLLIDRAYHYHKTINDFQFIEMQKAADYICGKHDFSSFMASGSKIVDTVRNIYSCSVERFGEEIVIRISADGFLYNMVRIICGTFLEVAKGNRVPQDIDVILKAKDRRVAGPTLPPQGLFLADVKYDVKYF